MYTILKYTVYNIPLFKGIQLRTNGRMAHPRKIRLARKKQGLIKRRIRKEKIQQTTENSEPVTQHTTSINQNLSQFKI